MQKKKTEKLTDVELERLEVLKVELKYRKQAVDWVEKQGDELEKNLEIQKKAVKEDGKEESN